MKQIAALIAVLGLALFSFNRDDGNTGFVG